MLIGLWRSQVAGLADRRRLRWRVSALLKGLWVVDLRLGLTDWYGRGRRGVGELLVRRCGRRCVEQLLL